MRLSTTVMKTAGTKPVRLLRTDAIIAYIRIAVKQPVLSDPVAEAADAQRTLAANDAKVFSQSLEALSEAPMLVPRLVRNPKERGCIPTIGNKFAIRPDDALASRLGRL
jgi:hypothetical protein